MRPPSIIVMNSRAPPARNPVVTPKVVLVLLKDNATMVPIMLPGSHIGVVRAAIMAEAVIAEDISTEPAEKALADIFKCWSR